MRLLLAIPILLSMLGCQKSETDIPTPVLSPIESPIVAIAETVTPDPKGTKPWAYEEIDQVVAASGKRNLRDVEFSENNFELRMWGGFGLTATQGFILNRTDNRWTAVAIRPELRKPRTWSFTLVALPEPKQSWERAWQSLLEQDVLALPDAETINCSAMFEDGYSYVVEVRKGGNYRTYSYDNPAAQFKNRCTQADNILNIARIISTDYGATNLYRSE